MQPQQGRDDTGVGSVRVTRSGDSRRDRYRAYRVLIDGRPVGRIRRGQSVTRDVAPGSHTVQIRIDWCASPEVVIDVAAGGGQHLECGPGISGAGALRQIANASGTYVWLRPTLSY